jgi:hypothetical protein
MGLLPAAMTDLEPIISGKQKFQSGRAETAKPHRFPGNVYRVKEYTLEPDSQLIFNSAAHPSMSICVLMIERLILQGDATIRYEYKLTEELEGTVTPGHRKIDGWPYNYGFGSKPPVARPGWVSGENGADAVRGEKGEDAGGFDAPPFVIFIREVTQVNIPHEGHFHIIRLDISGPRGGRGGGGQRGGTGGAGANGRSATVWWWPVLFGSGGPICKRAAGDGGNGGVGGDGGPGGDGTKGGRPADVWLIGTSNSKDWFDAMAMNTQWGRDPRPAGGGREGIGGLGGGPGKELMCGLLGQPVKGLDGDDIRQPMSGPDGAVNRRPESIALGNHDERRDTNLSLAAVDHYFNLP